MSLLRKMILLLSVCPVLQCLSLFNIRISTRLYTWELDIVSPTVKTLRIGAVVNVTSHINTYYLNAPWLEYLNHQRSCPNEVLVLRKVSSLLKASLSLEEDYNMGLQYEAYYYACGKLATCGGVSAGFQLH